MLQATATQGPQLRDIHVPPAPSWWPPAPGWWLLAILVVGLLIFAFLYFYRKWQHRRLVRALLAEFESTVAAAPTDAPQLAAALSAFLRRLAVRGTPSAATLAGDAWLDHLDAKLGGDEFSKGVGRALVEAPYRATADFDASALVALTRRAVKKICESEATHV